MDNYQKRCPIDGGTCGQGGTCFVCENEALGSRLAAAEARIAELEREVADWQDAYNQADNLRSEHRCRIAELEEALEPFAREAAEWGNQARDDDFVRVCGQLDEDPVDSEVTIGDLRRAAALLKEKE